MAPEPVGVPTAVASPDVTLAEAVGPEGMTHCPPEKVPPAAAHCATESRGSSPTLIGSWSEER